MAEQPRDILTGHEYDGIQEYDNPTPGWWWALFWATIIFSPLYFFIVLAADGVLSPRGQYQRAETAAQMKLFGDVKWEPTGETVIALSQDETWMNVASNIFAAKCQQCHGTRGEGLSGPNLTDDHYLWVREPVDMIDVIANGRNNNAMPAQAGILNGKEIILMSAYAASLRGQDLGGRPEEGEEIEPWPDVAPLDAEEPPGADSDEQARASAGM